MKTINAKLGYAVSQPIGCLCFINVQDIYHKSVSTCPPKAWKSLWAMRQTHRLEKGQSVWTATCKSFAKVVMSLHLSCWTDSMWLHVKFSSSSKESVLFATQPGRFQGWIGLTSETLASQTTESKFGPRIRAKFGPMNIDRCLDSTWGTGFWGKPHELRPCRRSPISTTT